jgi:hypothetical protein
VSQLINVSGQWVEPPFAVDAFEVVFACVSGDLYPEIVPGVFVPRYAYVVGTDPRTSENQLVMSLT